MPEVDPLTLDCFCPDHSGYNCELKELTLHVEVVNTGRMLIARLIADLGGGVGVHIFASDTTADGAYDIDVMGMLADWDSYRWYLYFGQTVDTDVPSGFTATFQLKQTYECTDVKTGDKTTKVIWANNDGGGTEVLECGTPPVITMMGAGGSGSATAVLYHARWFCVPYEATINLGKWQPRPEANTHDIKASDNCLCPQGGVPPYTMSVVSGSLPSGTTFAPDTGCLSGTATGQGTENIVFRVMDAAGSVAEVTCGMFSGCPACEEAAGNSFF